MIKRKQFLILIVLSVGCTEEKFNPCILRETIIGYYQGTSEEITEKRLYFYDGSNYSEMHVFKPNSDGTFSEIPNLIRTFTYNQGRITEDVATNPNYPTYSHTYEFSYIEGEVTIVNIHETEMNNGVISLKRNYTRHFIQSPKDATYLTQNEIAEDILEVYENGNLIKVGFKSDTGSYQAYDTTWHFPIHYKYDNQPNVALNNHTVKEHILVPNQGFCKNNMIEEILSADSPFPFSRKFSYSQHGPWLKTYTYVGGGRKISFKYYCEY